MNAIPALKPVAMGSDVAAVQHAAAAIDRAALNYRCASNEPSGLGMKTAYWNEYQRCVAHFMEVVSRG